MVDLQRYISKYEHFTRKINKTYSHAVCPLYFLAISVFFLSFKLIRLLTGITDCDGTSPKVNKVEFKRQRNL